MMSAEVEAKLADVEATLRALIEALKAENWRFTSIWETAAAEARAMLEQGHRVRVISGS